MAITETIVIDNGSGMCKAGFGGEDSPRVSFPAIVGKAKHENVMATTGQKDIYIGDEAQCKRGILTLHYPIDKGIVTNWEYMQQIWHHCFFNELRVDPTSCKVLLTEAPMNPRKNRERMADCFFNTFSAEGFYVGIQAIFSLYSAGRTSGLVTDSGDGVTHIVPTYEGYSLNNAISRLDLAGRSTTIHLQKLLKENVINLSTSAEFEVVRDIKEKLAYVALDFDKEVAHFARDETAFEFFYELPDKERINIRDCAFRCPECLFNPSMVGVEAHGISEMIYRSVKSCDIDVRMEMAGGIVLSGGTTLTKGIDARIHKDLSERFSANMKVKVIAPPDRKYSVWVGGSILSTLSTFQANWVTKAEYEEAGPSIVHRKCF